MSDKNGHRMLDSYNAFMEKNRSGFPVEKGLKSAHMMVLILKGQDYGKALKSYGSQRDFWVVLGGLVKEMRDHKLALELEFVREDCAFSAKGKDKEKLSSPFLSIRGEGYKLVTLFNDGEYCPVVFGEMRTLVEKFYIKMKAEANLYTEPAA